MKEQLLNTVNKLREEGVDIGETPPLFKWSYPEEPFLEFQLLIVETEQANLPLNLH